MSLYKCIGMSGKEILFQNYMQEKILTNWIVGQRADQYDSTFIFSLVLTSNAISCMVRRSSRDCVHSFIHSIDILLMLLLLFYYRLLLQPEISSITRSKYRGLRNRRLTGRELNITSDTLMPRIDHVGGPHGPYFNESLSRMLRIEHARRDNKPALSIG